MLPSVPKSFGRLSEVYRSAFLALQGKSNPLSLPARNSYLVILVDGLGVENIRSAGAHASFLNSSSNASKSLFSGFPTTTATSLASFATGRNNGSHGFIGYRIYDRSIAKPINLLNDLGNSLAPKKYQDLETISELARAAGFNVATVAPGEYEDSGFTKATMPAAKYLAAGTVEERFERARKEVSTPGSLVYLYIPELDQLAHRHGSLSDKWLMAVEALDSEVSKLAKKLPKGAGVVLTADHGVIDVSKNEHVYLDEYKVFDDLEMIGGDPRVGYLYFPQETDLKAKLVEIVETLGAVVDVTTFDELVQTGWVEPLSQAAKAVAPDLVILPKQSRVVYHRKFAKAKSLEMIGQHGGMCKAEWEVPFLAY